MKSLVQIKRVVLLLMLPGALIGIQGCGSPAAPPVPEAVLAGSWELTTVNPSNLPKTVLTFDSNGNLTNITYTVGGASVSQIPISGSTTVVDSTVTISETLPNGGSISFQGTLNEAGTQATGNIVAVFSVTNIFTTTLPGVPAVLTKQ